MSASLFSEPEARTLSGLVEALMPSLEPQSGDDPSLFALSSRQLGLDPHVVEALGLLPGPQLRELKLLLRVLEMRMVVRFLCGQRGAFSELGAEGRESVLRSLALSRIGKLRAGFQGLKRLVCFLSYSVRGADGANAAWPTVGYTPTRNAPARAAALRLTAAGSASLECDVCVIGSGAGGGVIAAELAAAGKRVIVLDAAAPLQSPDYDQHEYDGMRALYLERGLLLTRDLSLLVIGGRALGGGTVVNWQTCLRPPEDLLAEWAQRSGCSFFTEPGFAQSIDAVLERSGVGTGESIVNPNNEALRRGCDALGYRWSMIPRNSRGCDPEQCGYCTYGCRHGGKQSTAVTWLADAQQSGNTMVIAGAYVQRIKVRNGAVEGVQAICVDAQGATHALEVRARTVVTAAGGIHSPALLLRSGVTLPAVGRHLYLHPATAIVGVYDEPVEAWRGPPQTIVCNQFANIDGGYGCRLEAAPAHPGLFALAYPWHGAREHRRAMQSAANCAVFIVLTRDRTGGRVSVDRSGRPVIDYQPGPAEAGYLRRGVEGAIRVHAAAGAREVATLHSSKRGIHAVLGSVAAADAFCTRLGELDFGHNWAPLFSAHQMGTCRMGRDRDAAVCDQNGEVFGVRGLYVGDASAFPAASGVNPMITIMALAHHTAQQIRAAIA